MHNTSLKLRGERGPPPYFAGRDAELELLNKRLDATLRDSSVAEDGLLLFTGVPGVGKTHLVEHFMRQRASEGVKTLTIEPTATASAEALMALIGQALDAEDQVLSAAGINDKITGVRAMSAGVTMDSHKPEPNISRMLASTKNMKAWFGRALVLLVDEVQNMDARSADQIRTLHAGSHGCPIVAAATGLQHSAEVLSKHGISRMTNHRVGLLSAAESQAAVYHGLRNIDVDVNEDVAQMLAEASMCFPAHIHAYIEAAANVFDERGEVESEVSISQVLAKGRQLRERYYSDRLAAAGVGGGLYPLVEHMAANNAHAITHDAAVGIVGDGVVSAVVQHGVLAKDHHHVLSFGMPSFRSYLIESAKQYREIERRGSAVPPPSG